MAKEKNNWKVIAVIVILITLAFSAHWCAKALEGFTSNDVQHNIETVTGMLVFTMDGCGYCTDLKNNVLNKLTAESDNILIVEKGTKDSDKLISDWKVQGFPTIYFLKKGQKMLPPGSGTNGEYEGPRDLGTIQGHLKTVMQGYSA